MYGQKLKKIRKNLDLTQDKMAKILNVSVRNYAAYEREENNPPFSMLAMLCKNHNVNLNWFFADVGEMFNAPKFNNVKNDIKLQVEAILKEKGLL